MIQVYGADFLGVGVASSSAMDPPASLLKTVAEGGRPPQKIMFSKGAWGQKGIYFKATVPAQHWLRLLDETQACLGARTLGPN
jgi:hypothetical protein